jgi:hypothetical protein
MGNRCSANSVMITTAARQVTPPNLSIDRFLKLLN